MHGKIGRENLEEKFAIWVSIANNIDRIGVALKLCPLINYFFRIFEIRPENNNKYYGQIGDGGGKRLKLKKKTANIC